MDFLGAATIGILVIVLCDSVYRIGQIDLIGIDIVELGEGQRCLVAPALQVDLNSITIAANGAVHFIDNLERVFRIDKQLDFRADVLEIISVGILEPIDDVINAVHRPCVNAGLISDLSRTH